MFTFVIAECSRIYAAMVHSQHLSTHSVILVTWVYVLASADTNIAQVACSVTVIDAWHVWWHIMFGCVHAS